MIWRTLLALSTLAGLYLGWQFLDEWMVMQALASRVDNKWELTSRGWGILLFVWPIGVAGIIIGLIISPIADLFVDTAERKDHRETVQNLKKMKRKESEKAINAENMAIEKYKARTEAAEKRADKAENTALEKYQEERAELVRKTRAIQKQEQHLQVREGKLKETAGQVNVKYQEALEIEERSEQKIRLAYKRRDNAKGEAERYRRKSKRLEAKLQSMAETSMDY